MAKVSGKEVAEAILKKLDLEIRRKNLKPNLAIILANNLGASRLYVTNKIKAAQRVGVKADLFEFKKSEYKKALDVLDKLNKDKKVNGVIIQYPLYEGWDFEKLLSKVDPKKDVDGFLEDAPFSGATALGVWEMLTAFSLLEGFKKTEEFLKGKKIVVLGRGKTAGAPTLKLLRSKGFEPINVTRDTTDSTKAIKSGDVVISATGVKNIINKSNIKKGAYVIGVGVGKELIDGKEKIYGDIKEDDVEKLAKFYCPTIGGIGPLTIVSLLKNVVQSAAHPFFGGEKAS